jgi:hypothetical protein
MTNQKTGGFALGGTQNAAIRDNMSPPGEHVFGIAGKRLLGQVFHEALFSNEPLKVFFYH